MSTKKYKCPYCEDRKSRDDLSVHIERKHDDLIPKGYSPYRVAFNAINKKEYGTCIICKNHTQWNETAGRYDKFCTNPKCKEIYRKNFSKNMIKVYKTDNLLQDPKFQEKMLKSRSISGTYKFKDGGVLSYTGSFEKSTLEFFDKVMNIKSKDIMTPGPTFEYKYNGKTHNWITDILYVPANLVIEVKDGGDNPNNRPMDSYREKQTAKEKMITELGEFNYLRLTNNNFSQLFEILAELKEQALSGVEDKTPIIRIHENGIPPAWTNDATVTITYANGDPRRKILFLSDEKDSDHLIFVDHNGKFAAISNKNFTNEYTVLSQYSICKDDQYYELLKEIWKNDKSYSGSCIYEALSDNTDDCLCIDEIEYDDKFKKITKKKDKLSLLEANVYKFKR